LALLEADNLMSGSLHITYIVQITRAHCLKSIQQMDSKWGRNFWHLDSPVWFLALLSVLSDC